MSSRPPQSNPDFHDDLSRVWGAICLLCLLLGCGKPAETAPVLPFAGRTVRVLVVGDPPFAAELQRRVGTWKDATHADVRITETPDALTPLPDSDVVLLPAADLGAAVARGEVLAWPKAWEDDPVERWNALPETIRFGEMMLGEETFGVPLGSVPLVGWAGEEILPPGRDVPRTWPAWDEIAQASQIARPSDGKPAVPHRMLQPLGPGSGGLVLLSRAAAGAKHPSHYSTLFEPRSMEPQLASPPFVQALEELLAAAKLGPPEQDDWGPREVRERFLAGEALTALAWPLPPPPETPAAGGGVGVGIRFVPLPGRGEVFHHDVWEKRLSSDEPVVPLTAAAGQLGCVRTAAAQPEAAWAFLTALRREDWGREARRASRTGGLLPGDAAGADRALSALERPSAAEFTAALEGAFDRTQWLDALRIPGRERYLAALDRAVRRCRREGITATAALAEASATWREITAELGIDAQRQAYRRSIGLK